jgi:hypothetical protein
MTILAVKFHNFQVLKYSHSEMCHELLCLGQLHAATTGTYNLQIFKVSTEICALLCAVCSTAGQQASDLNEVRTKVALISST